MEFLQRVHRSYRDFGAISIQLATRTLFTPEEARKVERYQYKSPIPLASPQARAASPEIKDNNSPKREMKASLRGIEEEVKKEVVPVPAESERDMMHNIQHDLCTFFPALRQCSRDILDIICLCFAPLTTFQEEEVLVNANAKSGLAVPYIPRMKTILNRMRVKVIQHHHDTLYEPPNIWSEDMLNFREETRRLKAEADAKKTEEGKIQAAKRVKEAQYKLWWEMQTPEFRARREFRRKMRALGEKNRLERVRLLQAALFHRWDTAALQQWLEAALKAYFKVAQTFQEQTHELHLQKLRKVEHDLRVYQQQQLFSPKRLGSRAASPGSLTNTLGLQAGRSTSPTAVSISGSPTMTNRAKSPSVAGSSSSSINNRSPSRGGARTPLVEMRKPKYHQVNDVHIERVLQEVFTPMDPYFTTKIIATFGTTHSGKNKQRNNDGDNNSNVNQIGVPPSTSLDNGDILRSSASLHSASSSVTSAHQSSSSKANDRSDSPLLLKKSLKKATAKRGKEEEDAVPIHQMTQEQKVTFCLNVLAQEIPAFMTEFFNAMELAHALRDAIAETRKFYTENREKILITSEEQLLFKENAMQSKTLLQAFPAMRSACYAFCAAMEVPDRTRARNMVAILTSACAYQYNMDQRLRDAGEGIAASRITALFRMIFARKRLSPLIQARLQQEQQQMFLQRKASGMPGMGSMRGLSRRDSTTGGSEHNLMLRTYRSSRNIKAGIVSATNVVTKKAMPMSTGTSAALASFLAPHAAPHVHVNGVDENDDGENIDDPTNDASLYADLIAPSLSAAEAALLGPTKAAAKLAEKMKVYTAQLQKRKSEIQEKQKQALLKASNEAVENDKQQKTNAKSKVLSKEERVGDIAYDFFTGLQSFSTQQQAHYGHSSGGQPALHVTSNEHTMSTSENKRLGGNSTDPKRRTSFEGKKKETTAKKTTTRNGRTRISFVEDSSDLILLEEDEVESDEDENDDDEDVEQVAVVNITDVNEDILLTRASISLPNTVDDHDHVDSAGKDKGSVNNGHLSGTDSAVDVALQKLTSRLGVVSCAALAFAPPPRVARSISATNVGTSDSMKSPTAASMALVSSTTVVTEGDALSFCLRLQCATKEYAEEVMEDLSNGNAQDDGGKLPKQRPFTAYLHTSATIMSTSSLALLPVLFLVVKGHGQIVYEDYAGFQDHFQTHSRDFSPLPPPSYRLRLCSKVEEDEKERARQAKKRRKTPSIKSLKDSVNDSKGVASFTPDYWIEVEVRIAGLKPVQKYGLCLALTEKLGDKLARYYVSPVVAEEEKDANNEMNAPHNDRNHPDAEVMSREKEKLLLNQKYHNKMLQKRQQLLYEAMHALPVPVRWQYLLADKLQQQQQQAFASGDILSAVTPSLHVLPAAQNNFDQFLSHNDSHGQHVDSPAARQHKGDDLDILKRTQKNLLRLVSKIHGFIILSVDAAAQLHSLSVMNKYDIVGILQSFTTLALSPLIPSPFTSHLIYRAVLSADSVGENSASNPLNVGTPFLWYLGDERPPSHILRMFCRLQWPRSHNDVTKQTVYEIERRFVLQPTATLSQWHQLGLLESPPPAHPPQSRRYLDGIGGASSRNTDPSIDKVNKEVLTAKPSVRILAAPWTPLQSLRGTGVDSMVTGMKPSYRAVEHQGGPTDSLTCSWEDKLSLDLLSSHQSESAMDPEGRAAHLPRRFLDHIAALFQVNHPVLCGLSPTFVSRELQGPIPTGICSVGFLLLVEYRVRTVNSVGASDWCSISAFQEGSTAMAVAEIVAPSSVMGISPSYPPQPSLDMTGSRGSSPLSPLDSSIQTERAHSSRGGRLNRSHRVRDPFQGDMMIETGSTTNKIVAPEVFSGPSTPSTIVVGGKEPQDTLTQMMRPYSHRIPSAERKGIRKGEDNDSMEEVAVEDDWLRGLAGFSPL